MGRRPDIPKEWRRNRAGELVLRYVYERPMPEEDFDNPKWVAWLLTQTGDPWGNRCKRELLREQAHVKPKVKKKSRGK